MPFSMKQIWDLIRSQSYLVKAATIAGHANTIHSKEVELQRTMALRSALGHIEGNGRHNLNHTLLEAINLNPPAQPPLLAATAALSIAGGPPSPQKARLDIELANRNREMTQLFVSSLSPDGIGIGYLAIPDLTTIVSCGFNDQKEFMDYFTHTFVIHACENVIGSLDWDMINISKKEKEGILSLLNTDLKLGKLPANVTEFKAVLQAEKAALEQELANAGLPLPIAAACTGIAFGGTAPPPKPVPETRLERINQVLDLSDDDLNERLAYMNKLVTPGAGKNTTTTSKWTPGFEIALNVEQVEEYNTLFSPGIIKDGDNNTQTIARVGLLNSRTSTDENIQAFVAAIDELPATVTDSIATATQKVNTLTAREDKLRKEIWLARAQQWEALLELLPEDRFLDEHAMGGPLPALVTTVPVAHAKLTRLITYLERLEAGYAAVGSPPGLTEIEVKTRAYNSELLVLARTIHAENEQLMVIRGGPSAASDLNTHPDEGEAVQLANSAIVRDANNNVTAQGLKGQRIAAEEQFAKHHNKAKEREALAKENKALGDHRATAPVDKQGVEVSREEALHVQARTAHIVAAKHLAAGGAAPAPVNPVIQMVKDPAPNVLQLGVDGSFSYYTWYGNFHNGNQPAVHPASYDQGITQIIQKLDQAEITSDDDDKLELIKDAYGIAQAMIDDKLKDGAGTAVTQAIIVNAVNTKRSTDHQARCNFDNARIAGGLPAALGSEPAAVAEVARLLDIAEPMVAGPAKDAAIQNAYKQAYVMGNQARIAALVNQFRADAFKNTSKQAADHALGQRLNAHADIQVVPTADIQSDADKTFVNTYFKDPSGKSDLMSNSEEFAYGREGTKLTPAQIRLKYIDILIFDQPAGGGVTYEYHSRGKDGITVTAANQCAIPATLVEGSARAAQGCDIGNGRLTKLLNASPNTLGLSRKAAKVTSGANHEWRYVCEADSNIDTPRVLVKYALVNLDTGTIIQYADQKEMTPADDMIIREQIAGLIAKGLHHSSKVCLVAQTADEKTSCDNVQKALPAEAKVIVREVDPKKPIEHAPEFKSVLKVSLIQTPLWKKEADKAAAANGGTSTKKVTWKDEVYEMARRCFHFK